MAIITDVPGLEVTISVNGQTLEEYDDPNKEEGTNDLEFLASAKKASDQVDVAVNNIPHIVKYIQVATGDYFTVHFTKKPQFKHRSHHTAHGIHLDGHALVLRHEPQEYKNCEWTSWCHAIASTNEAGEWYRRKFRFGDLRFSEDID
jgi:hypothetical protein